MSGHFGTVMIGRLAAPFAEVEAVARRWERERDVPGFLSENVLVAEDGVTIVVTVVFEDEAGYRALSDDPEQAQWWETQMRPLLDADPQWIDGHWALSIDRTA